MAGSDRNGLSMSVKILFFCGLLTITCGLRMDSNNVTNDDMLNSVIGKHLENSILRVNKNLTVNALKFICRLLPCSDWSAWSDCGDVVGRYGTEQRSRQCGYNLSKVCEEHNAGMDTESRTCAIDIPWCPVHYVYTRNGFCVKMYDSVVKSWYDAQINCETDGGHLVNIDNKMVSDDIDETFRDTEVASIYAWIDGIRRVPYKDWEFRSGSVKPKFSNWYRGQPGGNKFPNCKCVIRSGDGARFEWCSSLVCGNRENFMCEIKNKTIS